MEIDIGNYLKSNFGVALFRNDEWIDVEIGYTGYHDCQENPMVSCDKCKNLYSQYGIVEKESHLESFSSYFYVSTKEDFELINDYLSQFTDNDTKVVVPVIKKKNMGMKEEYKEMHQKALDIQRESQIKIDELHEKLKLMSEEINNLCKGVPNPYDKDKLIKNSVGCYDYDTDDNSYPYISVYFNNDILVDNEVFEWADDYELVFKVYCKENSKLFNLLEEGGYIEKYWPSSIPKTYKVFDIPSSE